MVIKITDYCGCDVNNVATHMCSCDWNAYGYYVRKRKTFSVLIYHINISEEINRIKFIPSDMNVKIRDIMVNCDFSSRSIV